MPELLSFQTPDFELSIWSNDVTKRQKTYIETLNKRTNNQMFIEENIVSKRRSIIYFSPALQIQNLKSEQISIENNQTEATSEVELPSQLFFENVQYQFEWIFLKKVSTAQLIHKSQLVNEAFRFINANRLMPARFTGTINTGNNVGWMTLPLEYHRDGQIFKHELSFEVLPTKMDLHVDLPEMYREIDQTFPLWRFNLVEKTEQNAAKGLNRGNFPLMWLANFVHLRERLEQGLKVVVQAPHSRLQIHQSFIKAERMKGRITHRIGLKIKEDGLGGHFEKRYKIETKKLSVDTPENRFIKSVILICKKKLASFEKALRLSNQPSDTKRLSDSFLNELHQWQCSLNKVLSNSFFDDVGLHAGLNKESLVLQQKTGYSTVYQIWHDLKFYLDKFDEQANISVKSVAEIYEVWCFLTIKSILINDLGFNEFSIASNKLALNDYFEYQLKDGFVGAFEFKRMDGVKARLVHEPKFTKNGLDIRSYVVSQEPDIVLEIELSNGKRFIWLFDAKYRIKTEQDRFGAENVNNTDYVPDDAINQMHRYRDALIRIKAETTFNGNFHSKSRPTFGAFALYPGYFDQKNMTNPYHDVISEIGIGAFALLPDECESEKNGSYWLAKYLLTQLGEVSSEKGSLDKVGERLYLQEASRIPNEGMQQVLYKDLVAIVSLNEVLQRDNIDLSEYMVDSINEFILPFEFFKNKNRSSILKEIRYLAISLSFNQSEFETMERVWPIKNMQYVDVNHHDGKLSQIKSCRFELGQPLELMKKISDIPKGALNESIKLTTLGCLTAISRFDEIKAVYILDS